MNVTKLTKLVVALALVAATQIQANPLFTLESLERERAAMLETLTDASLQMDERQLKSMQQFRRITDIERMVLRDERISNSDKNLVKKAFDNYDLTFLVHASTEQNRLPMSHWLTALNITDDAIANSQTGVR